VIQLLLPGWLDRPGQLQAHPPQRFLQCLAFREILWPPGHRHNHQSIVTHPLNVEFRHFAEENDPALASTLPGVERPISHLHDLGDIAVFVWPHRRPEGNTDLGWDAI